jgi:cobyrinic acid a,c-diamide synthase
MAVFSKTRGFVIGAASSGNGKTTLAAAICRLLRGKGLAVQPFKTGPDFIDTTYLSLASGRICRNLDGFPCPKLTPYFYEDSCSLGGRADIAVVEGAMGLYDGLGPDGLYSTAWLARALGLSVILLVDARAAATSVAAVARGFAGLEPLAPRVAGVIANRVSGEGHANLIAEALERFAGIPLVGWLPKLSGDAFPSRHLGLVPAFERQATEETIENFAGALASRVDVEKILSLASPPSGDFIAPETPGAVLKADGSPVRVSVADDDAFCFHYRENWRLLERMGAEVSSVAPTRDKSVPEGTDLLVLPGGYPEEFLEALSDNGQFLNSVSDFARRGKIYAECGGMLYLADSMEYKGISRPMAGVIHARVSMTARLSRFGYVEGTALADNLLMKKGESVRAHEFHYSKMEGEEANAYSVKKYARPDETWTDGYASRNVLASYLHLNFYAKPGIPEALLSSAIEK